jgi:hypothetical protein
MKKSADDYRRKDVFQFRPFNATHIEITHDGKTVALDRVKGKGENAPDTWKRLTPTAGDLDKAKSDDLLGKLSNIRVSSFVDSTAKTGLDKPAMTVVVKFDEGKKEDRATFGQNGNDVYTRRFVGGGCNSDSGTLCLNGARFSIQVDWATPAGSAGHGQAVPLTNDTGYYWFFAASNVEMVIKVLNACGVNNSFWVFAGVLTLVLLILSVLAIFGVAFMGSQMFR